MGRPLYRVTFETVTPESAEHGDAETRGFIDPAGDRIPLADCLADLKRPGPDPLGMGLRDALELFNDNPGGLESVDPSDSDTGAARWITATYNHGGGYSESISIHFPEQATRAQRARLCRAAMA